MAKVRSRPRTRHHSHQETISDTLNVPGIALGAAAVCAIGAAVAYAFMPKKEYTWSDKLHGFADTIGEYAGEAMGKGREAYHTAQDTTSDFCDSACHLFSKNGAPSNKNMILGLIGASLLGASALYALNQKSKSGEHWNSGNLSEMATMVFDTVSNKLHSHAGKSHHHPVENILDWAMVGLNLWNEIKKRK